MKPETLDPCSVPGVAVKSGPSSLALAARISRFWAHLLDALITGVPTLLLVWRFCAHRGLRLLGPQGGAERLLIAFGIIVIAGGLYLAVNGYLLAQHGQSVGKRLCGIRIVRLDGSVPTLWDSFVKRHLAFLCIRQIPFAGYLLYLIEILFIFRENRRCLHDELADTLVVKVARVPLPAPATSEPPPPPVVAVAEPAVEAPAVQLELCPYCAEPTSEFANTCRGCGRNPFVVDGPAANRALTVEELQQKAARLYGHGLQREALAVHLFATERYPNLRPAWQGLLNAPNAAPAEREEAQRQLDRIHHMLYG